MEKLTYPSSSEEDQETKRRLCVHMPSTSMLEDLHCSLLMQVFSFLPFRDVFRIRAVCRLWHSLIRSKEFEGLWKANASTTLVWSRTKVLCGDEVFDIFDCLANGADAEEEEEEDMVLLGDEGLDIFECPANGADADEEEDEKGASIRMPLAPLRFAMEPWLQLWQPWSCSSSVFSKEELPPLHPPFCSTCTVAPYTSPPWNVPPPSIPVGQGFEILASAGGLVCGRIQEEPGYAVAVGNPLTCVWKKLPPVPNPPEFPPVSLLRALMWVDSQSTHYKVALFAQDQRPPSYACLWQPSWILIYNSRDDIWEHAPQFDWPTSFQRGRTPCPSFKVPLFFHPAPPPKGCTNYTFGIAAYDTASRSWNALAEAQLPGELYDWERLSLGTFPYKDTCLLIAVGVDRARRSLVSNAWILDEQSNSFRMQSSFCANLGVRWYRHVAYWDDELDRHPFRFMPEGNAVVIWPVWDQELWPLLAYNTELSRWTMMQEVCRPQLAFETLCALSPSLSAAP